MKLWLCLSFAAILPFVAPRMAAANGGKLAEAEGEVWLQAPGSDEARGRTGADLAPGTKVRTGKTGRALVRFADGSELRVRPSSSVSLSGTTRQKKKNSVVLFFGRVWSKVARSLGAGEATYEVTTPNAVCGVRGTQFETAGADDGSVRVRVSEGKVAVEDEDSEELVEDGYEIEGDENGVEKPATAEERAKWAMWEKQRRERLRKNGREIVDKVKAKIMSRKEALERLRARQKEVETARKAAEKRARTGDSSAIAEIKRHNKELAEIADQIADLGDAATSQFGLVDHFADLASDPRFRMVDRKYLEAEAASLRRVKATLDKLVAEGTDISIEAMDKMLDDMGSGKRGDLKDDNSAADDLFGGEDMDMNLH